MIANDQQLSQALEQISRLHMALAALHSEVAPVSAQQFRLLAEGPLAQVRELQAEADAYVSSILGEVEAPDLLVRLMGRGVVWQDAPSSILVTFLEGLRKGLQTVTEFIATGGVARRPTAEVMHACDVRVMALQPGSLRIALRLPTPPPQQTGLFAQTTGIDTRAALRDFLQAASWAASAADPEDVVAVFHDERRARVLLNAVRPLVPRARGTVEEVELSETRLQHRVIRLTQGVHARIDRALAAAVHAEVERFTGELREIDLDKKSFKLRRVPEVRQVDCEFDDDLLEAAVGGLDRKVEVTGVRLGVRAPGQYPKVRLTALQILGERAEEPEEEEQ